VFGSMLLTQRWQPLDWIRPFLGFGAIAMLMLTMMQLLANQFGLDRQGFRALVLSACPRRQILLGKNLAHAPLPLLLGVIAVGILQALCPMRLDHFLATLVELGLTYLIVCSVGNLTSIIAPMPFASGSLKPAHPNVTTVLVHLFFGFIVLPMVIAAAMIPLGLELLLHYSGWLTVVPIYLIASVVQLVLAISVYRVVLTWQGRLLQAYEQKILAAVMTKIE
jgi:hypothetical protein